MRKRADKKTSYSKKTPPSSDFSSAFADDPAYERRIREQMRICRSVSDDEIRKRIANYKKRLNKTYWQAAPCDMDYYETCYVMYEAYQRIAKERGIV